MIGKAGSGKTMLLADLVRGLVAAGVEPISADYESRDAGRGGRWRCWRRPTRRRACLRGRGVPATTIHRILYTPLYHPDYEAIAEWLTGKGERPKVEGLTEAALDRALAFYRQHPSIPGALASAGLRGSDFIKGWKRRDEPLDIGLIDEASMLDARQYADLRELFRTLVLFGDPAQLAPVGGTGGMVFDDLPDEAQARRCTGCTGRRRTARSSTSRMRSATRRSSFDGLRGAGAAGGAARRPGGDRRAGRCRGDGAGAGAGLAQRRRGCG